MIKIKYILQNLFRKKTRPLFFKLKFVLGFFPVNLSLYETAFVHKSASKRIGKGKIVNNERLEYLGDAILDAIVADFLFEKFPLKSEGFLTQMRSKLVNRSMLNKLAIDTGIDQMVVTKVNRNNHKYIYGDAFEAVIGAIYLDRGYDMAKHFILNTAIVPNIDMKILIEQETDFKSRLIEWSQKHRKDINFEAQEKSVTPNQSVFEAFLMLEGQVIGKGEGRSKKLAEQQAAKEALEKMDS